MNDRLKEIKDELNSGGEIRESDIRWLIAEVERLRADIRCMVEKAADKNLDGYRELGQKAAAAENKADALQIEVTQLSQDCAAIQATLEIRTKEHADAMRIVEQLRIDKNRLTKERDSLDAQAEVAALRRALETIQVYTYEKPTEQACAEALAANNVGKAMLEEIQDLLAKLKFALLFVPCEEGVFTFPDGDTWDAGSKAGVQGMSKTMLEVVEAAKSVIRVCTQDKPPSVHVAAKTLEALGLALERAGMLK